MKNILERNVFIVVEQKQVATDLKMYFLLRIKDWS